MTVHANDLLNAATSALQDLNAAGQRAITAQAASSDFGQAQRDLARAGAFQDAMLAAIRARFSEIKEISR